ncbi:MAG: hypothetical protein IJE59_02420 [Clostridia bacterium]|nr:hypothetical protein [Clostridia bacterium]
MRRLLKYKSVCVVVAIIIAILLSQMVLVGIATISDMSFIEYWQQMTTDSMIFSIIFSLLMLVFTLGITLHEPLWRV